MPSQSKKDQTSSQAAGCLPRLVRLLSPICAAAGNVLLSAGAVVKIVAVSDSGDEFCVEHTDDIGGWPGERNRRWVFKMHTEEAKRPSSATGGDEMLKASEYKAAMRLKSAVEFPARRASGSLKREVGPHAANARKSSRHNCPICGRWLDARMRCAKVWSDGEGGWEHD